MKINKTFKKLQNIDNIFRKILLKKATMQLLNHSVIRYIRKHQNITVKHLVQQSSIYREVTFARCKNKEVFLCAYYNRLMDVQFDIRDHYTYVMTDKWEKKIIKQCKKLWNMNAAENEWQSKLNPKYLK